MNDNPDEHLNSFLSDSSFVILGQGSLSSDINVVQNSLSPKLDSAMKNGPSSHITDQDFHRNSNVTNSLASRDSTQDIQGKLDQLLKENYQLKETLNQNNLAMKTQFETLVMWQQEVFKTHQNHKQKFSETRDLVLKLRAENSSLKKQVEEGLTKSQMSFRDSDVLEKENSSLKQKVDELQEKLMFSSKYEGAPTQREQELNSLVENLRRKLQSTEEIVKEKMFLEAKCKTIEEEYFRVLQELDLKLQYIESLKKENEDIKSQRGRLESLPSLLPNSEARAQISNLFKQLEDERLKVSKLKEELKIIKSKSEANESASSMLSDCISALDDMKLSYNKQNERFTSMNSWLCLAEESMVYSPEETENRLKSEISFLKKHLVQEQASSMEKRESLAQMQIQFEKLLRDYEELQMQYKKLEEEAPKVTKFEGEIENLNSKIKERDEMLSKKIKECESLQESQKKLELECEEVGILRAQVELYQTDFNAEREAREKLVGEKEEMAEQVRALQRRIKELEGNNPGKPSSPKDEQSASASASAQAQAPAPAPTSKTSKPIRRSEVKNTPPEPETVKPEIKGSSVETEQSASDSISNSNTPPTEKDDRMKCPLCWYRSRDLEDLERHANFCLDTYMVP